MKTYYIRIKQFKYVLSESLLIPYQDRFINNIDKKTNKQKW